ncbi:TPA: hypothetical protein HA251_03375 [Candidatus Woesearchaeota archaeon]|nr:hypothetical protein [Candidatus Woesearchaeota archaeon]
MPERHNTGGQKSFHYSKEDLERIRTTDTASTKEFKAALAEWRTRRAEERIEEEKFAKRRRTMILLLIFLFLALIFLFALRAVGN